MKMIISVESEQQITYEGVADALRRYLHYLEHERTGPVTADDAECEFEVSVRDTQNSCATYHIKDSVHSTQSSDAEYGEESDRVCSLNLEHNLGRVEY